MVIRETRNYAHTSEEADRLARRACPNCGSEREGFQPRNRTAICCKPACSAEYWGEKRLTVSQMRRKVHDEQGGLCAHCKQKIQEFNATEGPYGTYHYFVLDHIRPIAMEGPQWARENLQVLCERCNKIKTARDMGRIARWKKYHAKGITIQEDNSRQALLLQEA